MPASLDRSPASDDRCEAARYALLRRLAPSMRHHLVVNLQPIGMVYEVVDHRLRLPEPDLANVHAGVQKIHRFARAALDSCLDVVTWLAPDEGAVTTAFAGTRECLALVATNLSFRGYTLRNDVGEGGAQVRRCALRNVLTAALIQLTDERPAPAELTLQAQAGAANLQLRLAYRAVAGEPPAVDELAASYRPIVWSDVQALAWSEGVGAARPSPGEVVLTLPWAVAGRA